MTEHLGSRDDAVDGLQTARRERGRHSERYEAAKGSSGELPAFTELRAAEDRFAAREAALAWIDRRY